MDRTVPMVMAVWALAFAQGVAAAPLAYDEAVQGDLPDAPAGYCCPGFPALVHLGPLGAGVNTVRGSMSVLSEQFDSVRDLDEFGFSVPAGLTLTDVVVHWTLTPLGTGVLFSADVDVALQHPATSLSDEITIDLFSTGPVSAFTPSLPLAEGAYQVAVMGDGLSGLGAPVGWRMDYTWTLTTVPVGVPIPEPTSGLLLSSGLCALALLRNRRRPGHRLWPVAGGR